MPRFQLQASGASGMYAINPAVPDTVFASR